MALNRRGAVRIAIRTVERGMMNGINTNVADAEEIFITHSKDLFDESDVAYMRRTVDEFKKRIVKFNEMGEKLTKAGKLKTAFSKSPLKHRNQAMQYYCEFEEMNDSERLQYFENREDCKSSQFANNLRAADPECANVDLTYSQLRLGEDCVLSRSFVNDRLMQMLECEGRKVVFEPMVKVGEVVLNA